MPEHPGAMQQRLAVVEKVPQNPEMIEIQPDD
jgi:hypothetical protein